MKEKILELMKKYHGGYQPIIIKGEIVNKGWRGCEDRWNIIKPYLKENTVIMDMGSHFGYFGLKIENELKSLTLSVEANYAAAEIQRMILEANESQKVYLIHRKLDLNDLIRLSRTTEAIDTILCLSMIYEFPKEQVTNILHLFSMISPNLIIEAMNEKENYLTPELRNNFKNILNNFYDSVTLIGNGKSVPGLDRPIYYCQKNIIHKTGLMPYFGAEHGGFTHKHEIKYENNTWMLNDAYMRPGLNIDNLLMLNLTYPSQAEVIRTCAYLWHEMKHLGPTDISLKNNLITPEGIICIDYLELKGTNNVYGQTDEDYNKKVMTYTPEMINENLIKLFNIRRGFI